MPHIQLKIAAGQTEENKKKLADLFTKVITENTHNTDEAVSVAIVDVPMENWKDAVYDPEIKPNLDKLYKKPGYDM